MFTDLVVRAEVFLLVFARVFTLLAISPLFSSSGIPGIARVGLAFFTSAAVFPWASSLYTIPETGLGYAFLLLGEVLVGLITGFFVLLYFSLFQIAGEFFGFQMGFNAASVYDPLSQEELPLMGQVMSNVAVLVFLVTGGFLKFFLSGVYYSIKAFRSADILVYREDLFDVFLHGLAGIFQYAFVLALPLISVLLLVSVSMGLLGKAAPQMNLLLMGFPISIGVGFILLLVVLPFVAEMMSRIFDYMFYALVELFSPGGGS
ncbi:flagellar biosynthetic protein FliR [Spirochaeta thermophila DSM 6578]|uniref:Flagellar biosynthetic protein FliR n=1 Tax=Winmispira thermophila (strain ATCC 700085 / DSM 6578 / Z-1203) TaxID=869211 RepID=G0GCE2_WINT7|nr:flagellar biosynthetic protein FliR [Spirochaeta thermophila]AEJ61227.1 flagellar biosynthetic protein FliR [Spirochaeta thermophila DSM 6578]